MDVRANIVSALQKALAASGISVAAEQIPLERTAELAHGDYASSIALAQAKAAGMNPRALAEKVIAELGAIDGVSKIEIAGLGFINFALSNRAIANSLEQAIENATWGKGTARADSRILVEYTDPNPFKEFHIGHLMSNTIGESIARLLQFSGAEVKRANYQGDVGPHVAKCIWGIKKLGVDPSSAAMLGKAYATGAAAYEDDPEAKKEIDDINRKVYEHSDGEIDALYEAGREASLAHFEKLYDILGTKFDYYFFESQTTPIGIQLVREHPEVFEESDGAIVYKGERDGLHTRVFITSHGLPTYETKDLGLIKLKADTWPADVSITITANEQADYFKVMKAAAMRFMPELAEKVRHITHGMMRFAEGKMSSRKGNVVTGESLVNDLIEVAKERAKESRADDPEELARQVAVAAIKYQILRQGSGKDIIFDREKALSLEGDSGPYLQYAYARASQVVQKAKAEGVEQRLGAEQAPSELARLIDRFPEVVGEAAATLEPHPIATYLLNLAATFNRWYANEQILDGSPAAARKVALTAAFAHTLKTGLWLLGIPAPEKM